MPIKAWLSKNFIQQMAWSSIRDYPPKKKKPWLFDNFMEMEETHSDHMEAPWKDPILPLPPSPDIPQTPEDLEPDPCSEARVLWIRASPEARIDCNENIDITLIFSPDFQCIEIKQLFYDEDSPKLADSLGNTFEHFTNIENITGGLTLEKGCDDEPWITIMAQDCLCGGIATLTIWLDNCGANCGEVSVDGSDSIASGGSEQYVLTGYAGTVEWSINPESESVSISSNGILTTTTPDCGNVTVIATTSCCGAKSKGVVILGSGGYWDLVDDTFYDGTGTHDCVTGDGANDYVCDDIDGTTRLQYNGRYSCESSSFNPAFPGEAPCAPGDPNTDPECGYRPVPEEACTRIAWITRVRTYDWVCE